jgi:hypothetical protein
LDVVIDQTYAPDTTEYTLKTLENINVGDESCFGFVTNQSAWRYDKKSLGPKILGKYNIHFEIQIFLFQLWIDRYFFTKQTSFYAFIVVNYYNCFIHYHC